MSSSSSQPQRPAPRPASSRSRPSSHTTPTNSTTLDSQASITIPLSAPRSSSPTRTTKPTTTSRPEEDEKRCWICFVSASEEALDPPPKPTIWKSPCKCSLVAHESCLLDWIADIQKTGRERGGNGRLECPQCKTPIRLKEKGSLVLDVADAVQKVAGSVGAFMAFGGVGSVLFVGCTVYDVLLILHALGVNTLYTLLGPSHAASILLDPRTHSFRWSWRLGVGLPLIPIILVGSRTRHFDSILPILPVLFFCQSDPLHFTLPPSPEITLALLPYVRSAYNTFWGMFIAPHEQRWIREVTPSFVAEAEATRRQQEREAREARERERRNRRRAGGRRGGAAAAVPLVEAEVELDPGAAVDGEWNGEVMVENHNVIVQGSNVTTLVLGALIWPTVARMAGAGLGKLPPNFGGSKVKKWLPSLLARNLVGGLMVIVLKDFISLYCKYKRAQKFRSRTVLNYADVKRMAAAARAARNSL